MYDLALGIVTGLISAFVIWTISSIWNVRACKIVTIQAKRMQVYLQSMSNDITWGVEDNKDFYYDSLISTGMSINEYVKNRRLSEANYGLLNSRAALVVKVDGVLL